MDSSVFDSSHRDQATVCGTVVCASCGATYVAIDPRAPTQAYGCAAVVFFRCIQGFYGSETIDTERWEFEDARPEWVKDGDICDRCIRRLISEGQIALHERGLW